MPSKPADFEIDNASGSDVRDDLNNVFGALRSNNGEYSGAPTTKYPYMWYADSSTGRMSFYLATPGNGKIDFISLTDGSFFGPNGSAGNPSYTFTNSASTGFYRSASNQIGVSNNSVNTALFKTTGTEIKGKLEVAPASGDAAFDIKASGSTNDTAINLIADTTYTTGGLSIKRLQTANGESQIIHRGTGGLRIEAQDASGTIDFKTNPSVTRWQINAAGAYVWAESTHSTTHGTYVAPIAGDILPRGIISRRGVAVNALTANPYNFFWDTNHLECWIDGTEVGNVSGPTSDYRIKKNVTLQTESGIDKVKLLKPITYEIKDYGAFKADGEKREGFLAHEVQEAIPSGATGVKDGEGIQSLRVDALISVLTKALQEAVAKIETLETKVAALEAG
tara:strand:+ start:3381 stop:4562 length:1182 start_codon:yes stop_codon:yes gene_type:complete